MLRCFFALACVLGVLAGQSQAGTIANVIQGQVLTRLSDNSLEFHVTRLDDGMGGFTYALPGEAGYSSTVNEGDALFTIARIDQVNSPFSGDTVLFGEGGWDDELTLVSVIEVFDKVELANNEGFRYTFQPFTGFADPLGLGWSAGTMAAFYSDPSNDYTNSPSSQLDGFLRASNGSPWWEFGMFGGGVNYTGPGPFSANALGEFWTANTFGDDIEAIAALPAGTTVGGFQIGLNLIAQNNGLPLLPVTPTGLEFTGGGNLVSSGDDPVPGGFQLYNDLNFTIRAIPEPSSVAFWSVIAVGGVVGIRRRKRLAQAACQA